jgi:NAD(P)-dependent dehydrogenase (short-subunit alcohol dehydrogenase family)
VLAQEGLRKGVAANAICPGWTETRMMEEAVERVVRATRRAPEDARRAMLAGSPLGRAATAEEVASATLAVVLNAAVNGQSVVVDGGEYMT